VLVVVGIVVLVVGITAGIVVLVRHHDTSPTGPDATYLATVQPQFPRVTAKSLVALGHTICLTFDHHLDDPTAAEYDIASVASKYPNLPPDNLVSLMHAAVGAYCPDIAPMIASATTTTTTAP
jgi:Protein of unknown function (DUF732)